MRPFEVKRHRNGRCIQCGEKKDPPQFLRCEACRTRARAASARHYDRVKAQQQTAATVAP